jgi:hypothetical protein
MRPERCIVVCVAISAALLGGMAPAVGAATTGGSANAKAIATAGVLVGSDLPATYTQAPRDTSSDAATKKLASKIAACKKLLTFMAAVKGSTEVKSDAFTEGQTTIDNTVTIFPSAAKAKAAMDTYAATGLPACFGQLVTKIAQQQGGRAQASIKKVHDVTAGDQAVAYEGPVDITESDGTSATLAFGDLAIRVGRAVAVYSYNHDARIDIATDLKRAVVTSGSRLQRALAT